MSPSFRLATIACACAFALAVAGCGQSLDSSNSGAGGGGQGAIVVGSSNFPENVLLGQLYAAALKAHGVDVTTKLNIGSREALLPAMERGDVNLAPEYTGGLLDYFKKGGASSRDTAGQIQELSAVLPAGLTLLRPSRAQDQNTVTCTRDVVRQYGLRSLTDLARVSGQITAGGPPELATRGGFGSLKGLQRLYGIRFKRFLPLDAGGPLTVAALKAGKIQCANLFSTQSAIAVNGFVTLADPKRFAQSEAIIPLIAKSVAKARVVATLNAVSAKLTTQKLKAMVKQVEVDKADAGSVAEHFLDEEGLAKG